MAIEIAHRRVAVLSSKEVAQMPWKYFDDNGTLADGLLFIVPGEDAPAGAKVVDGYQLPYTGKYGEVNPDADFCGWKSLGIAYAIDLEVAKAIAREEGYDIISVG